MKKIIFGLFCITLITPCVASSVCGDGYVLTEHRDIDGIPAAQCEKLWCRDLETGKTMGSGDKAATGYISTIGPNELCMGRDCVMCFGARRWCDGVVAGVWNPEYGAYTRGGDNATYESYLRGGCFAWNLEKPRCADGEMAILKDGAWICSVSVKAPGDVFKSSIRRTSGAKRITF